MSRLLASAVVTEVFQLLLALIFAHREARSKRQYEQPDQLQAATFGEAKAKAPITAPFHRPTFER